MIHHAQQDSRDLPSFGNDGRPVIPPLYSHQQQQQPQQSLIHGHVQYPTAPYQPLNTSSKSYPPPFHQKHAFGDGQMSRGKFVKSHSHSNSQSHIQASSQYHNYASPPPPPPSFHGKQQQQQQNHHGQNPQSQPMQHSHSLPSLENTPSSSRNDHQTELTMESDDSISDSETGNGSGRWTRQE
ncbi:hypothetical protein BGZ49_009055, partial [Haplosporangium sp. Z 27]